MDRPDQPILIRISRKEGGELLDLDLLATDGDNAFRGKGTINPDDFAVDFCLGC